jgi:aspartate/methionine/tyrosine aminotransferase
MRLSRFELDRWLDAYKHSDRPIQFDLGSSTGVTWTLRELAALDPDRDLIGELETLPQTYVAVVGEPETRRAVAAFHEAAPEHVRITTGASEAIHALLCLLSEPGANVVLPSPCFSTFEGLASGWGFGIRTYVLSPSTGFAHAAESILAAVDGRTRLVVVNTPHNPTGAVAEPVAIQALAAALTSRGVPLLVDEVYHGLYHDAPVPSAARLDGDVIVVGSMSKSLSLSGLRTGWLIDRNRERLDALIDVRTYFSISNSAAGERLAAFALTHAESVIGRTRAAVGRNLALLDALFERHADLLSWVRPRGSTVAFPAFTDGRSARPFCLACAEAGVLVVPGDCFGCPPHFRLGYGGDPDAFVAGLARVDALLAMTRHSA